MINYSKTVCGNECVNKIIESYRKHFLGSLNKSLIYSNKSVFDRICQIITARITHEVVGWSANNPLGVKIDESSVKKKFAGLCVNFKSNNITPSIHTVFICCLKFLFTWAVLIYKLWAFTQKKNIPEKNIVILEGLSKREILFHGKTSRFENYCINDFQKLAGINESFFVVQTSQSIINDKKSNFIYCKDPVAEILSRTKLSVNARLTLTLEYLGLLFNFARIIFSNPIMVLLWKDYIYYYVILELNGRKMIKSFYQNNSNWLCQYLWQTEIKERSFTIEMTLYSMNIFPLQFEDNLKYTEDHNNLIHPGFRYIRVDTLWLWDKSMENKLRYYNIHCPVRVSGPILWYSKNGISRTPSASYRVVIFDVTPFSPDKSLEYGFADSYYSHENMKMFIQDIVYAVSTISNKNSTNYEIYLKHKRPYHHVHDQNYLNYINDLCLSNLNFILINDDENIYEAVLSSDLVISVPYTSTTYVARWCGAKAIFYDPTQRVRSLDLSVGQTTLVRGRDSLHKLIEGEFSLWKKSRAN
jgi:polysaccharide biosynthesis PFTS motif protein